MVELDRRFPIPKNVVDVRLDDREFYDQEEALPLPAEDSAPRGEILVVPTEFQIVSQRVRYLDDGTSVVDVIIDFPGSIDGQEFDVRVYQE